MKTLLLLSSIFLMASQPKMKAHYARLDPTSLSQNFAFYELYPETKEGQKALQRAWKLLSSNEASDPFLLPKINLTSLVNVINRQDENLQIEEEALSLIETLGKSLHNRRLKGYQAASKKDLFLLDPQEVDLARGLFLEQFGDDEKALAQTRMYEALIDLMALQILGRLQENASPYDKISAINHYIFHEMGFRFPPHSLFAKDIDAYTFLPSVIDSRKGVCLGVSILYLAIAQRIDLTLEPVTPPGHIFVRYQEPSGEYLNIETTARGIHVPTERYLGIDMKEIPLRNLKQVIGLAFINEASVNWQKEDYQKAVSLYEKALPYMPNDPLLEQLLSYNYLFIGKIEEGKQLLQKRKGTPPPYSLSSDSIASDFLDGYVDIESLKTIFLSVDETRNGILDKQKKLEDVVKKCPRFRAGLLQYAATYLQLGREKEGEKILDTYHSIDPQDLTINYYLSLLALQRYNYQKAWKHLKLVETLLPENHKPKALKEIKTHLTRNAPEALAKFSSKEDGEEKRA